MKRMLILCFLLYPAFIFSQTSTNDWASICNKSDFLDQQHMPEHRRVKLNNSRSIVKQFLFLPLFFYQKLLSEQLASDCEFEISCSNFCVACIKEFGAVKGIALTADRLMRCNGQAQFETEDYLINHKTSQTIDAPTMYRFKE